MSPLTGNAILNSIMGTATGREMGQRPSPSSNWSAGAATIHRARDSWEVPMTFEFSVPMPAGTMELRFYNDLNQRPTSTR
jgi:hypothetical protein